MSPFRTIEIDFDVHKAIEARQNFADSPNDVLRRLLRIEDRGREALSGKGLTGRGPSENSTIRRRANDKRRPAGSASKRKKRRVKKKGGRYAGGDVIRGQFLHVRAKHRFVEEMSPRDGLSWWGKGGLELPHGTKLQMRYNGRKYTGVIHNGDWLVEGRVYKSPSHAAGGVAVTKNGGKTSLDGWRYWEVKRPSDENWIPIEKFR